jgi:hypothetical protein
MRLSGLFFCSANYYFELNVYSSSAILTLEARTVLVSAEVQGAPTILCINYLSCFFSS